jgi:hypothetical protein
MKCWLRPRARFVSLAIAFAAISGVGVCFVCAPGAMAQATGSDATAPNANATSDHPAAKDDKAQDSTDIPTVKLRILVTGNTDTPIGNASVYVRYNTSGGFLHHDKLAEMDLKTNQDGSVKVPAIPQGKIMIQVVAPGWHTFGKWYDIDQSAQVISIKLEAPPHWY